ncbi:unnamed protein product [Effrenium voratum]|nr:unnamed protein product [Effrenium voratum]
MAEDKQRRQKLWKSMQQRGIQKFMQQRPADFRRRARKGIPPEYRAEAWKAALHADAHAKPGLYQGLQSTENEFIHLIEIDIPRTFPEEPSFTKAQQMSLFRILKAYANLCPDVGYCQGMNFVAGLLLLVAQGGLFGERVQPETEEETFWMFFSLMECGQLNGFYRRQFPLLKRYLWAFDELIATFLPELNEHFCKENLQHAVYLHQWFLTLFISSLPLPMVLVIWDAIICGGLQELLPISLSVLQLLRSTLLEMKFEEIVSFFKTMRCREQEDTDFESIGRIAVSGSESIRIPDEVAEVLHRPLPLRTDDMMERTPQSPPRKITDSDEDFAASIPSPCSTGATSSEGGAWDYLRQFKRLNHGVLNWWTDTKGWGSLREEPSAMWT